MKEIRKIVYAFLIMYLVVPNAIMGMSSEQTSPPCVLNGFELEREESIGEGAFGALFLECDPVTKQRYACKYPDGSNADLSRVSAQEISIMSRLEKHPCIVEYVGVGTYGDCQVLVMEYVEGISLYKFVKNSFRQYNNFSTYPAFLTYQIKVVKLFVQLMLGLHYLHKKNIMHRDIKLENLLIDSFGFLKICDFGFAQQVDDDQPRPGTPCGPADFSAPEIGQELPYNFKVDMWSAGVVLYIMLMNSHDLDTCLRGDCIYELQVLSRSLLQKDPVERPTAFGVLSDPFMQLYLARVLEDVANLKNVDLCREWSKIVEGLLAEMRDANVTIKPELHKAAKPLAEVIV